MSGMGYVVVGWVILVAVLVGFAALTVVQGRRLSRRVPAERRRWM